VVNRAVPKSKTSHQWCAVRVAGFTPEQKTKGEKTKSLLKCERDSHPAMDKAVNAHPKTEDSHIRGNKEEQRKLHSTRKIQQQNQVFQYKFE
jgi:hypothetical protein